MNIIAKYSLFSVLLILLLAVEGQTQEDYFPLQINNQWTYRYHSWDFNNNITDSVFTFSVIDSTQGYYVLDNYFIYWASTYWDDSTRIRIEDGKVIRIFDNREVLWYDFTVDVGEQWTIPVQDERTFPGLKTDVIAELISKKETFILGSDTLRDCYKFRFHFTTNIFDVHPWDEVFAPGIGLIEGAMTSVVSHSTVLLEAVIDDQPVSVSLQVDSENLPRSFFLHQNYPNPFNPTTSISYELKAAARLDISIYNLNGQRVRTLVSRNQQAGRYVVEWDGTDNSGNHLASGVYYYQMKAYSSVDVFTETRKLLLVR